jgi:glycosyltransferase involved in cell wall biosynthesis
VGLVVHSLGLGGLEEVLSLLARALPAQGVVPSVLCTHGGGPLAVRLERAGVSVTVGDGRPASWRAWLHHTDPELVSTHFADPEVVEVLAEAGMPIVETIQNTYAWFDEARWAVERAKTDHLSATIAVSDIVAEHHARHVGTPVTPHVVPNAVDPARAASVPRSWARRLFGLGEREVVLVHHGRLARQKNLVGLVRAFAEVAEVTPEAKLVLAGPRSEPAYARELKKAAPRAVLRDRVRWLPPVPHVGALLSAADLFVSNSFFEGWSVAASEASWVGLPLVLSECGGSRELIGPDGRHGRLVPNPLGDPLAVGPEAIRRPPPGPTHENERALAEALRDVIGAREAWQGRTEERRRDARARLGPEPMARRYAEIFRSVLGGGS